VLFVTLCFNLFLGLFPYPPRQELAAAGDAEVAVDGFGVVVHRVGAQAQARGDLLFTLAGEEELEGLPLAGRQRQAGGRNQREVEAVEPRGFGMEQFQHGLFLGEKGARPDRRRNKATHARILPPAIAVVASTQ
jgi:hypothetical protein